MHALPDSLVVSGMIDEYRNLVRVVRLEGADYIPMDFHINSAWWHRYLPEAVSELTTADTMLFVDSCFVAALGGNGYNDKE